MRATLSGIRRQAVAEGRLPHQAAPLCAHHHAKIMAALSHDHGLRAARDRALLWLMRDGMLRRSELCNLQLRDFQIEADCSGRLTIRKSKTDQQGAGCILYLSAGTARCVEDWIVRAEIYRDGPGTPLVRKVNRGGGVGSRALFPNSVSRILKRLAKLAGIDPARVSGHSCRIGMAIDLARAGTSLVAMQQAGPLEIPEHAGPLHPHRLGWRGRGGQLLRTGGKFRINPVFSGENRKINVPGGTCIRVVAEKPQAFGLQNLAFVKNTQQSRQTGWEHRG